MCRCVSELHIEDMMADNNLYTLDKDWSIQCQPSTRQNAASVCARKAVYMYMKQVENQIHASCKQPRGIGTSEFSEIASFTLTTSSRLPRLDKVSIFRISRRGVYFRLRLYQ